MTTHWRFEGHCVSNEGHRGNNEYHKGTIEVHNGINNKSNNTVKNNESNRTGNLLSRNKGETTANNFRLLIIVKTETAPIRSRLLRIRSDQGRQCFH